MLYNNYIEKNNVFFDFDFNLNQNSLQKYSTNMIVLQDVIKKMTDLKNMSSDKINVDNTEQLKKEIRDKNAQILLIDDLNYNFTLDF